MYFINTNAASPFALGRITDLTRTKSFKTVSFDPARNVDPFLKEIDKFGKLEGNFNNLPFPKNFDDDDAYFINHGSSDVVHNYVDRLRAQEAERSAVKFVNVKVRKSSKLSRDRS